MRPQVPESADTGPAGLLDSTGCSKARHKLISLSTAMLWSSCMQMQLVHTSSLPAEPVPSLVIHFRAAVDAATPAF